MTSFTSLLAGAAGATLLFATLAATTVQDAERPSPEELQAMMEKAAQLTQPGENHEVLKRFLGSWETSTHFIMDGRKSPGEAGQFEVRWLIEGRFIISEGSGTLMGQPARYSDLMGYDNMKQSFVHTFVNSMDTAMRSAEGDLTRDGRALISYGTLDEYLTGEHDKMVKYVWRFVSEDEIVLEVHDLNIGEDGTQVMEVVYTRAS